MNDRDPQARALDEQLSALLDGELDAAQERALRARVEAEPRLALRLAELEAVDATLRALPAPEVPGDLRARLAARIAADGGERAHEAARHYPGVPATRSRARWAAGAALAAGLALYLVVGDPEQPAPGSPPDPGRIATLPSGDPERGSGVAPPAPIAPEAAPGTPAQIAESSGAPATELPAAEGLADERGEELAEELAESLPDEDIAIALEYDALRDFELIDQLELLEVLAAAEEAPTSG